MSDYYPVSFERHSDKRFRRISDYYFAESDVMCPLVAHELPKAMHTLPLAFAKSAESYHPVVLMGFQSGKNLLVSVEGRWRSPYVPQAYRTYPFILAHKGDERVLCINEKVGIADPEDPEGLTVPFFDSSGNPSQFVAKILDALNTMVANREQTRSICKLLQEFDLLEPWTIEASLNGQKTEVTGVYRINEIKLNGLPSDQFIELRDNHALVVAYCQLFSMSHIHSLITLANQSVQSSSGGEIVFSELSDSGTISFDGL